MLKTRTFFLGTLANMGNRGHPRGGNLGLAPDPSVDKPGLDGDLHQAFPHLTLESQTGTNLGNEFRHGNVLLSAGSSPRAAAISLG